MSENYKAWSIRKEEFPKENSVDKLYFLIGYAILAPSSHNSQPWRFEVSGNYVDIFLEESRLVPVGDPESRLAYISLGGAIEHILLCGSALGLKLSLATHPSGKACARIVLEGEVLPVDASVLDAITRRVSNRYPYKPDSVSPEFIPLIQSKAFLYKVAVNSYDAVEEKQKIAEVAVKSSVDLMASANFRNELSHHVHSNITKERIGMPAFGMGIPTPPSFLVPFLLRHFNMQKMSAKKDIDILVNHTPAIIVLSTQGNSVADWINVGRLFSYLAISGAKEGLQTAPWGSAVITEEAREQLVEKLNLKNIPQFVFRIGIPTKETTHSPRLTVEEVAKRV